MTAGPGRTDSGTDSPHTPTHSVLNGTIRAIRLPIIILTIIAIDATGRAATTNPSGPWGLLRAILAIAITTAAALAILTHHHDRKDQP